MQFNIIALTLQKSYGSIFPVDTSKVKEKCQFTREVMSVYKSEREMSVYKSNVHFNEAIE